MHDKGVVPRDGLDCSEGTRGDSIEEVTERGKQNVNNREEEEERAKEGRK